MILKTYNLSNYKPINFEQEKPFLTCTTFRWLQSMENHSGGYGQQKIILVQGAEAKV